MVRQSAVTDRDGASQAIRELNGVRAEIKKRLGAGVLKELHRENRWLDIIGAAACLGAVALLFGLLASLPFGPPPFGLAWALAFIAQGFALQALGLLSHDAFNHRRIWGDWGSWLGAMLFSIPVLLRPTHYAIFHRDHHLHLGTARDPEIYKQDLDSVWKRLFFLTVLGDRLVRLGKLSRNGGPRPVIAPRNETERRRLAAEKAAVRLFLLVIIACAALWPRPLLAGYILPLLIATPLASTLRTILEHSDVDPGNAFHVGTYYRTNALTRLVFVADSGDCHLVHHIFDHIPWYRMGRAVRLMRPVLMEKGVVERRSLIELLAGWFIHAFPHRSLWYPLPRKASPGL